MISGRKTYAERYRARGKRMLQARFNHWLKSKPRVIRQLANRFPINSQVVLDGVMHYLLGYTEDEMLIVSPVLPSQDYDGAIEQRKYVCAHHLERA